MKLDDIIKVKEWDSINWEVEIPEFVLAPKSLYHQFISAPNGYCGNSTLPTARNFNSSIVAAYEKVSENSYNLLKLVWKRQ